MSVYTPIGGGGGVTLTPVVVTTATHTQTANELSIVNTANQQCSITLPLITGVGQMAGAWWPASIPATFITSSGSISPNTGATIGGLTIVDVSGYLPAYSGPYYVELIAISLTEWIVRTAVGTDIATSNADPRYGGMIIGGPFYAGAAFGKGTTLLVNANYPYTTTTVESNILASGTGTRSIILTVNDNNQEYWIANTSAAGYVQLTGGTGPSGIAMSTIDGLATYNLGPGDAVHLMSNPGNFIIIGAHGRGPGNHGLGATGALQVITTARTALPNENTLVTGASTITVTLPTLLTVNARNRVSNGGSGTVTVAPGTGTLTSLAAVVGNMTLAAGATAEYMNNGTNYFQVA